MRLPNHINNTIQIPVSSIQKNPDQGVLSSGDLNTGLVWYSNGQKLSDLTVFRPPFEYLTSKTCYSDAHYSDPQCIRIPA